MSEPKPDAIPLIYSHHLIPLAHGYPCNVAPPSPSQYPLFPEEGFKIGDLFSIRPRSPGHPIFLFNIFDDKSHPRQFNTTHYPNFQPAPRSKISERNDIFKPDYWHLSPNIKKLPPSSPDVLHEFDCGRGAFLYLPDGATRKDLLNRDCLETYIRNHATEWYALAPVSLNGSLFLITGLDTAERFCCGSIRPDSRDTTVRVELRPDGKGSLFRVSTFGSECDIRTSTTHEKCTQPLFFRGFSIGLNGADYNDVLVSQGYSSPILPDPPSLRDRLFARIFRWQNSSESVAIPDFQISRPPYENNLPFNVSFVLLYHMIPQMPEHHVAIIHDDIWCKRVKESARVTESVCYYWDVFVDNILRRHRVVLKNGIMSLKPIDKYKGWSEEQVFMTFIALGGMAYVWNRYY